MPKFSTKSLLAIIEPRNLIKKGLNNSLNLLPGKYGLLKPFLSTSIEYLDNRALSKTAFSHLIKHEGFLSLPPSEYSESLKTIKNNLLTQAKQQAQQQAQKKAVERQNQPTSNNTQQVQKSHNREETGQEQRLPAVYEYRSDSAGRINQSAEILKSLQTK